IIEALYLESAAVDRGTARIFAVATTQPLRIAARHDKRTVAGDRAAELGKSDGAADGHGRSAERNVPSGRGAAVQIGEGGIEAVEVEQNAGTATEDRATQTAERGDRIGTHDAAAYLRASGIGIIAGEHQGTVARLHETARA